MASERKPQASQTRADQTPFTKPTGKGRQFDAKVGAFAERVIRDGSSAIFAVTVALGDRLGLYQAMAGGGPLSVKQIADRCHLAERHVREWLAAQVAAEYLHYDPHSSTYTLPDEHAAVPADPTAPNHLAGFFEMLQAVYRREDRLAEAYRTGTGVDWHEYPETPATGSAKFFRPQYQAELVQKWIPALSGVEAKLLSGAKVADIGCGLGYTTAIMAQAYPQSQYHGFDSHPASIDAARKLSSDAGVSDRVEFTVAKAQEFDGTGYDLVTCFQAFHEMGDPASVARQVRHALAPQGWVPHPDSRRGRAPADPHRRRRPARLHRRERAPGAPSAGAASGDPRRQRHLVLHGPRADQLPCRAGRRPHGRAPGRPGDPRRRRPADRPAPPGRRDRRAPLRRPERPRVPGARQPGSDHRAPPGASVIQPQSRARQPPSRRRRLFSHGAA
jgi:2-polyprenyl-3-methyl-5-hydroxy-6-metoxy-1,4-benzoquinol methylase